MRTTLQVRTILRTMVRTSAYRLLICVPFCVPRCVPSFEFIRCIALRSAKETANGNRDPPWLPALYDSRQWISTTYGRVINVTHEAVRS
jgi:hypothetical protein